MFLRTLINIALLLAAACGACIVLAEKVPYAPAWQYYLYQACPWVLFYGSIKAWHRCYTWRRMMAVKNTAPDLGRGKHRPSKVKQRPGILEQACFGLLQVAIASIFKQLEIPHAMWWIGLIISGYVALRSITRKGRLK